jgi:hypothetical protein
MCRAPVSLPFRKTMQNLGPSLEQRSQGKDSISFAVTGISHQMIQQHELFDALVIPQDSKPMDTIIQSQAEPFD